MSEEIDADRRRFVGAAVTTIAGAELSVIGSRVQWDRMDRIAAIRPVTNTSFAGAYARKFSGKYSHRVITGGVGHNLPQEAPEAFAKAVVDVDAY